MFNLIFLCNYRSNFFRQCLNRTIVTFGEELVVYVVFCVPGIRIVIVRKLQRELLVLVHLQMNTFLSNYQSNFLHESLARQTLSCRGNLAVKSKDFVLCI